MKTTNELESNALEELQALSYEDEIENPNATAMIDYLLERLENHQNAGDQTEVEDCIETLDWFYRAYGVVDEQPYYAIEILLNDELREALIRTLLKNADDSNDNDDIASKLEKWDGMYPDAKAKIVCGLIAAYEEALGVEFFMTPMPASPRLN